MIKHDLSTLRQRLRALHDEMGDLTRIPLGRDPLLKAYLSFTPRTCGNAGCRGYQPVVAFWVEQKMILMDQFRDGNSPYEAVEILGIEGH